MKPLISLGEIKGLVKQPETRDKSTAFEIGSIMTWWWSYVVSGVVRCNVVSTSLIPFDEPPSEKIEEKDS